MKLNNFRDIRQGLIIEVLEGDGVQSDPSRIVRYIYDTESKQYIGKVDPLPE